MPAAPSPFLGSVPRVDINNRVEGRAPPESPPSLSAPAPRYFTVHPPNQMRQGLSGGEAAGNSSFLRPARVMRVQSHPALTAKSSGGGEAGRPQLCLRGSLPRLSGASRSLPPHAPPSCRGKQTLWRPGKPAGPGAGYLPLHSAGPSAVSGDDAISYPAGLS